MAWSWSLFKRGAKFHWPALAGFVAIVAILNLPLMLNIDSHVIGRPYEDVFEVLWQMSWMDTALLDKQVNPFFSPDVFYPQGWYLASGAQPSWYLLSLAPFTRLLGPVTTFNVVQLLAFVVGGFGIYLLVYTVSGRRLSSFIAGCIYMVAPVLTVHQAGHLNMLLAAQFLPYAILGAYLAIRDADRISWRWSLFAGVALALTILGIWYFLFIATVAVVAVLVFTQSEMAWRTRLTTSIIIGIVCLVLISPFAYLTWQARRNMFEDSANFPQAVADSSALSPDRLFVPNPLNSIWGEVSQRFFPLRGEQDVVAIGFAALILALVGVARTDWFLVRPFVAISLISLVLALGLTLYWNGHQVLIAVPETVERLYKLLYWGPPLPEGTIAVPLPGLLLHRIVPFYASMRVLARFVVTLMLGVAVLAGLGSAYLLGRGKVGRVVVILLGVLVLVEGLISPYSDFTEVSVNNRTVDEWLARQPEGSTLIEYPRGIVDKIAMYSQAQHGQRVANGYMSQQPAFLREVDEQLGRWPDSETMPLLREWQIEFVLVSGGAKDKDFQEQVLPSIGSLEGLCPVESFDDGFMYFNQTHVFEVLPPGQSCRPVS